MKTINKLLEADQDLRRLGHFEDFNKTLKNIRNDMNEIKIALEYSKESLSAFTQAEGGEGTFSKFNANIERGITSYNELNSILKNAMEHLAVVEKDSDKIDEFVDFIKATKWNLYCEQIIRSLIELQNFINGSFTDFEAPVSNKSGNNKSNQKQKFTTNAASIANSISKDL